MKVWLKLYIEHRSYDIFTGFFYRCYAQRWLWNGLPRLAEHSITYLWLTSFTVDWLERVPICCFIGAISAWPRVTTCIYHLRVNFLGIFFKLWPMSWPLYVKASPSSRLMLAAVAVICPRRPMASRGSKALRVNLERLNHGPHEYLQSWIQEFVTLVNYSLKSYHAIV